MRKSCALSPCLRESKHAHANKQKEPPVACPTTPAWRAHMRRLVKPVSPRRSANVGRDEPRPGADAAGLCPILVQMWRVVLGPAE